MSETIEVTQEQAKKIITEYHGRHFFTVKFVKRTNGAEMVED